MSISRLLNKTALAAAIFPAAVSAQMVATNAPTELPAAASPGTISQATNEPAWAYSASVYTYIVPGGQDYAQPTVTADRGMLHLEARYNYENLETGSVWVGCNFAGGNKISWQITPMLGGVFGETTGIAPGYEGSVSWWKFQLYSEGEYVFDTGNSSDSFFYNWSELTLAPWEWLRFGLVTQRTKVYDTDRDIQRGLLVGLSYKRVDLTTYVFNPDESRPTVVVAVALNF